MNPFGIGWQLLAEATKNVTKAPGWVPLGVLCYVAVTALAEVNGPSTRFVQANKDAIALGLTALLYVLGDALDTLTFKRFSNRDLDTARSEVQLALGLSTGYYVVAKAIATCAGEYEGTRIHFANEAAKFFRSAIFLSVVAGVILLANGHYVLGILACAATLALFILYIRLKQHHMQLLYERVARSLSKNANMSLVDLPVGVRMYFWSGTFAASAIHEETKRADA